MTMGRNIVSYLAATALYFVCMGLYPISAQNEIKLEIVETPPPKGELGSTSIINCTALPETANITWLFNGAKLEFNDRIKVNKLSGQLPDKDLDGNSKNTTISIIHISNSTHTDSGNYTCEVAWDEKNTSKTMLLDLSFPAELVNVTKGPITTESHEHEIINITCVFKVFKVTEVRFYQAESTHDEFVTENITQIDPKYIKSTHTFRIAGPQNNGTYCCQIIDPLTGNKVIGTVDIIVRAPPKLTIDNVVAVNTTELYLKWTVSTYNCHIRSYTLKYKDDNVTKNNDGFTLYTVEKIATNITSFLMVGLEKSHFYQVALEVNTTCGVESVIYNRSVATLDKEPIFVPNISINGFSATSVTIGWAPPPPEIEQFIHYYLLKATKKDENETRRAYHSQDGRNLPYMFDNLEPHSTYVFQVCACSDYTKRCGALSEKMEAATLDGTPSKPSDVVMECDVDFVTLKWAPPVRPNAEIKGYSMELTGNATFLDRYGNTKIDTWGPHSKFTTNDTRIIRFDKLQPNTNYTVKVSAMTRTRRRGEEEVKHCTTKPAQPDAPPRPRWRKIFEDEKYLFKMILPRVSERNGPICCYRVYMVRLLPHSDWKNLPLPKDVSVLEYKDAHAQPPALGAYITDIFSNTNFPPDAELVMGDGSSRYNRSDATLSRRECGKCLKRPRPITFPFPTTSTTTTTTTTVTTTTDLFDDDFSTADPAEPVTDDKDEKRERRSYDSEYTNNPTMLDKPEEPDVKVFDGPLDTTANYTLFVELITPAGISAESSMYSDYLNVLMPAATPVSPQPASPLEIALQATCAVAALILLLMIIFCIRQTRRSRKMPPHAHLEMDSLPPALRCIPWFRRAPMAPVAPPDMAPIPKEDLPKAYAERQADSDYGFQKEFEMLPECFTDRTTHASETRENQPKNRYPDIKAYDQTRVKLSQIDSITGSDYINANYVTGYQEAKKFICAQGPTDTTVNDFWRMIWEQGLELIVMLTNLEEYSKVKCSKYWPDEVRGSRAFGAITVHHVSERRYSDYIVRELRITKQPTTSDGQPIVENGGAKRNGDVKEANESSAPTSPRDTKDTEGRIVKQYHFLMWKDFAAPEHAYSILKFIKRVNEACSECVGVSCVVHCSAGVGRTGTLVALDCLLHQLAAQGHVAVFNTVAELRRQRNFLVQSLKQYVFVYRALVEFAHYGDTEIPACRLRSTIDRLRSTPPHTEHSLLEAQFQKIQNSPIPEPVKSCAAGAAEELRSKNRSNDVLPYDRNRVILAPIPGRDYSTYINASFIEAYDNSEGFIITQDPMPSTIMDFWRMVSEHNVTTIVMLSELGEGKCPRYWDDGTAQYEHISVQYEESESCPYYTRRQFRVVNNKSGCVSCVRQLQYQGWPTAPGHVPEVTRGLADLADAARAQPSPSPDQGTMLVHCQLGTERSSLFVALCILICQVRTERRVDVCSVARKIRSQRTRTIDTFLQYEFLHRAILNYAELHNLLEDG